MSDKIYGWSHVGLKLMNWHSSMGDPIYAVGSSWFAGKGVPAPYVKRAAANLRKLRYQVSGKDRRELEKLVRYLDRVYDRHMGKFASGARVRFSARKGGYEVLDPGRRTAGVFGSRGEAMRTARRRSGSNLGEWRDRRRTSPRRRSRR